MRPSEDAQLRPLEDHNKQMHESPIHLVETLQLVENRGRKRSADPVLKQQVVERFEEPMISYAAFIKEKRHGLLIRRYYEKGVPL